MGFYIHNGGSTACLHCAEGSYAAESGGSAWLVCPEQLTILFFGVKSINDCVCIEGTIEVNAVSPSGSNEVGEKMERSSGYLVTFGINGDSKWAIFSKQNW